MFVTVCAAGARHTALVLLGLEGDLKEVLHLPPSIPRQVNEVDLLRVLRTAHLYFSRVNAWA